MAVPVTPMNSAKPTLIWSSPSAMMPLPTALSGSGKASVCILDFPIVGSDDQIKAVFRQVRDDIAQQVAILLQAKTEKE